MSQYLNRLYVRFVRPVDPGLLLFKYAAKATVCCLASLLVAWAAGLEGERLLWWLIGALCPVLFRTGSTLGRRKMYALILLGCICGTVPLTAIIGSRAWLSLGLIFILSFACFFVSAMGVSAATLGTGCLVVSIISVFDPAPPLEALMRSASLLGGGLTSFLINFYLWPFDPEKVLLTSARLAAEDMGFYFEGLCTRMGNTKVSDAGLAVLGAEAMAAIRRYRIFLESFNVDPLKGSRVRGGPGLTYFGLVRLYESLVGLAQYIHFCDARAGDDPLRTQFTQTSWEISRAFEAVSTIRAGTYVRPDFHRLLARIEEIQETLVAMNVYRRGGQEQDQMMAAWGAVHELKNVVQGLGDLLTLAEKRFRLERAPHGS